jgi:hypothetical protein
MNSALLSRKYEFEVNVQAFIAATFVFVAVVFVCCAALTARRWRRTALILTFERVNDGLHGFNCVLKQEAARSSSLLQREPQQRQIGLPLRPSAKGNLAER